MSMEEWGWGEQTTPEKAGLASDPLTPGRHTARIKAARWKVKERVSDKWRERNPQGHYVLVVLEIDSQGQYHEVFVDVPRHWQWLFKLICDATGTDMPTDYSWQPSEWVGVTVDVETSLYQDRRAQVDKWFQHEPGGVVQPPPKKPAARTPAAKVAAAKGEEPGKADDIPF